ncbi:ADP-ribose pyrophosphatase [Isoalcanivorax pacificus W11-5]|uniref:ADP-ribose pyrophosphatase n=1 Tax=Isoalcanivorax pacificus W11-5 TaxID=391936 RepID=A0A0B4XIK2_9GAMM|nr:NUDIX domain-containing protein [Isoalcanivorax pacificus]AJD46891.1 ADP-ribose pyrophosphatase [Isoalcanivorax pacificus W11-5]
MTQRPSFSRSDVDIIERESPYEGFFRLDRLRLRHRLFNGGWSRELTRELFVRTEAVAVLPWDPVRDEILLVEQFRVGALDFRDSPWCLELIAGIKDKDDESLEDLVRREAQEEAGISLGELIRLPGYLASPGGSNERLSLFFAVTDLSGAGGVHGQPDEGEDIRVLTVPMAEVPALIDAGQLDNAPCLVALHWLMLHHQRLRGQYAR